MFVQPHYTKSLSNGLPVVSIPLILYTDDSSGNRSRKWNKFDNWALLLAGNSNENDTYLVYG